MSSRNPSPLSIVCAARGAAALPGSYRADHAIFPRASSAPWPPRATNSGSDWIGYPNTNGNVPVIQ